ncbi:MAG: D-2-hydroxyacid dehydrogenase [bacterium]|nr:D-2-hydroxyacid dehydrogenase [bacterium]
MSTDPIVVCLHHPAKIDLDLIRDVIGESPRPLDLRLLPFKENVKLRRARLHPPIPAELLAVAPEPDEALLVGWKQAEILLTLDLPVERLGDMPNLRWVQAYSAGFEQFPLAELTARGVSLTNAAGAGAPAIAEFVFGRLIEVFRNLRGLDAMQREHVFHRPGGRSLAGRTLGIIGLGAIGSEVARLARAFGMKTIATRRSARPGDRSDLVDVLQGPEGLSELLGRSDVVVLCAPATAETNNLIDEAALEHAKAGSVLCNVARGSLVDETALIRALESGHLAAAILDVTKQEPLPADAALWSAPNIYLSPHSSIPPDAYDERLVALFAENLRRYLADEPLINLVDPARL